MFALVRTIAGTTAGLFASLLFAVSPAIIVRGTMGWFKSEPMGLFYGILASYFLLSGIRTKNKGIAAARVIAGGVFLAFGLGSWGGIQYFVIPIAVFTMALPFLRSDYKFLLWAVPLFGIVFLSTTAAIERPGLGFVLGIGGAATMASIAIMAAVIFIKSKSGAHGMRNSLIFLFGGFAAGMLFLYANSIANILPSVTFRYANALNPFLTTVNPLVDSVAEHATSTTAQSFWFLSILMVFAGIGAWLMLSGKLNRTLKERPEMAAFALIMGMTGIYVSSAFIRLELFASIAVIILSSIAISTLAQMFFNPERPDKKYKRKQRSIMHAAFIGAIVALLIIPTMVPASNWVSGVKAPPTHTERRIKLWHDNKRLAGCAGMDERQYAAGLDSCLMVGLWILDHYGRREDIACRQRHIKLNKNSRAGQNDDKPSGRRMADASGHGSGLRAALYRRAVH